MATPNSATDWHAVDANIGSSGGSNRSALSEILAELRGLKQGQQALIEENRQFREEIRELREENRHGAEEIRKLREENIQLRGDIQKLTEEQHTLTEENRQVTGTLNKRLNTPTEVATEEEQPEREKNKGFCRQNCPKYCPCVGREKDNKRPRAEEAQ